MQPEKNNISLFITPARQAGDLTGAGETQLGAPPPASASGTGI